MLVKDKFSGKTVSTFGEFMICPPCFFQNNKESNNIASLGAEDFSNYRFVHSKEKYRGDSKADIYNLLENIKNAVMSPLNTIKKKPLLLLSDGKDSMGLALALSSAGVSCKTLTFLRKEDESLRAHIHGVSVDLGHDPFFVNIEEILSGYDQEVFDKACAAMSLPVLDQGLLFFLFGCKVFFSRECLLPSDYVLIDGLGNDEHFGYLASKAQLGSFKLSMLGLWNIIPKRRYPFLRWFIRSPSESHGDLSALSAFFPFGGSFNLNEYFSNAPKSSKAIPYIDFRAFSRGSFHDHQCMMGKSIVTASTLGCDVIFPWIDEKLMDYCFNLPVPSKFDFKNLKNKVLLRDLLESSISWKQQKRGVDLYLDLDMESFRKKILINVVPEEVIKMIDNSRFAPLAIKKRAYLELLNFYGYCRIHGFSDVKIKSILLGN